MKFRRLRKASDNFLIRMRLVNLNHEDAFGVCVASEEMRKKDLRRLILNCVLPSMMYAAPLGGGIKLPDDKVVKGVWTLAVSVTRSADEKEVSKRNFTITVQTNKKMISTFREHVATFVMDSCVPSS